MEYTFHNDDEDDNDNDNDANNNDYDDADDKINKGNKISLFIFVKTVYPSPCSL